MEVDGSSYVAFEDDEEVTRLGQRVKWDVVKSDTRPAYTSVRTDVTDRYKKVSGLLPTIGFGPLRRSKDREGALPDKLPDGRELLALGTEGWAQEGVLSQLCCGAHLVMDGGGQFLLWLLSFQLDLQPA